MCATCACSNKVPCAAKRSKLGVTLSGLPYAPKALELLAVLKGEKRKGYDVKVAIWLQFGGHLETSNSCPVIAARAADLTWAVNVRSDALARRRPTIVLKTYSVSGKTKIKLGGFSCFPGVPLVQPLLPFSPTSSSKRKQLSELSASVAHVG